MESCAERAQGHVELRGQNQQKERRLKFHFGVEQAETDLDGDDGGAEGGEQFQCQRREEGDAQDTQCGVAELVADSVRWCVSVLWIDRIISGWSVLAGCRGSVR